MVGEGSSFSTGYTAYLAHYCGTVPGTQTGTGPSIKIDNFTGGARIPVSPGVLPGPETGFQPGGSVTYYAGLIYGGHYYDFPMASGNAQVAQPGDVVTSRPINAVSMTPGSTYCYRVLAVPASTSSYFPVSRNSTPDNGEYVIYGDTIAPTSAMGAFLTTTASAAANTTTLTFASTTLTGFGNLSINAPTQIQAPCLSPNTQVTATTSTTFTISPATIAACPSGQNVNIYATIAPPYNALGGNSVGGVPAANILFSTPLPNASVLIAGDSKGVGRAMTSTLTTNQIEASGQNVLTFATTALTAAASGGFLYPGEVLPHSTNPNIPLGSCIGAITPTTVSVINCTTGAAANLTAQIASGATVYFGLEKNAAGQGGAYEKGLGLSVAWANQAVSSDSLFYIVTNNDYQYASQHFSDGFKYLIDEYGINDFSAGRYASYALFLAAKKTLWTAAAQHGMRVVATTINSEDTSSYGLIPGVLPTIAAGGTGYAPSATFNVTLAGGTLSTASGNPGTATTVSVTTNSSGVVTTVNAVSSIGYYSAYNTVPSSPNAATGGTGSGLSLTLGQFYGWLDCASQTPLSAAFAAGGIETQYNDALRAGTTGFPLWGVLDVSGAGGQQAANDNQCWQAIPAGFAPSVPGITLTGWPMTIDGTHDVGWGQDVQAAVIKARVAAGLFN